MLAALFMAGSLAVLFALGFAYAIVLPRQPHLGPVAALDPDTDELAARLRRHIEAVASRPHSVAQPAELEAAAQYIEAQLVGMGLKPVAHRFTADGVEVRNIEVVLGPEPGTPAAACYVVGAHYDSTDDSPGANDNGTGVAALLEMARSLAKRPAPAARFRLVFFVNEEQPYGKTELMGSWRYAHGLSQRCEPVSGMIALETLGYFSDKPGSQRFPFPFGLIYPDRGNFVAFVALPGARRFLHTSIAGFRRHAGFPSIGGIAPGFIPGIDLSDHWSFHQFGFPALMITDTAPFRYIHYHSPEDLPDTVDCASLARIVRGLDAMLVELAGSQGI